MMKLQVASDLHLEFLEARWPNERLIQPAPGADLLVLAGDIANGASALELFANWPVPVIYVAGNHEFYGHPVQGIQQKIRRQCLNLHGRIAFLENNSLPIPEFGVRILAATLWTDYRLPRLNRTQQQVMEYAGSNLNDHFQIKTGRHTFAPANALKIHEESRNWLEQELAKPFDGKTVVATHHGCHPLSVHPRYIGQQLNAAFVSDLSGLMSGVDLWLHGHVHDSFDYQVGRCRVVTNPAGYITNRSAAKRPEEFQFENPAFNAGLVVEV